MRILLLAVVALLSIGVSEGRALTATPTNTATPSLTPTPTPTFTPTLMAIPTPADGSLPGPQCNPTHLCSLKHGSVSTSWASCASNLTTATVIIPGIQRGDLFLTYPPITGNPAIVTGVILGNNQVKLTGYCSSDPGVLNTWFIWWDRTDPKGPQFDTPPDLTL